MAVASPSLQRPRPRERPRTRRRVASAWFVGLTCLAIAVLAPMPYLTSSLQELGADPSQIAATYVDQPLPVRAALYLHVGGATLALLLSPLQLAARVRARAPRLHRAVGRTVLAAIAVAGTAGLVIAPFTRAGVVGATGFGTLAAVWVTCAAAALLAIRRRDVAAHRRWAVRAFALTYAGVTLRIWLPLLITAQVLLLGTHVDLAFDRVYPVVAWLSWVPNLLVAQRVLRRWRPTPLPRR